MDDHKVLQWAHAAWARRILSWRPPSLRRLLHRRHHPRSRWRHRANRALSGVASLALILVLARQLAGITWALIPGAPLDAPAPIINSAASPLPAESPVADVQRIVEAHLFGEYAEQAVEPAVQVLEVPETELDLSLSATVSGTRGETFGVAVIASGNIENSYSVNEEIEGTGGAVLRAVHSDRVILDVAGQFQTLRLPRRDAGQTGLAVVTPAGPGTAAQGRTSPNPFAPPRPAAAATVPGTSLSGNASRLRAIVRAVPHVEQGTVVGFRLEAGGNPEAFETLGLRSGDVVAEINGTALTDPGQAPVLFDRLAESTQANLVLIRDGAPQILTIDTSIAQAPAGTP